MTIKFNDGHEIKIDGDVTIIVHTDAYGHVIGELWERNERKSFVKTDVKFRFKDVDNIST